jgi:hypothetical protein
MSRDQYQLGRGVGETVADLACQLDSTLVAQVDVKQDEVEGELDDLLQRIGAVGGDLDDCELGPIEQGLCRRQKRQIVINDQGAPWQVLSIPSTRGARIAASRKIWLSGQPARTPFPVRKDSLRSVKEKP